MGTAHGLEVSTGYIKPRASVQSWLRLRKDEQSETLRNSQPYNI